MDINLNWNPEDPNSPVMLINDIDIFFQEVELGIKVYKQSIWNKPEGVALQDYIFNKYISEYQIRQEITSFISRQCSKASLYNWEINVSISNTIQTDNQDILIISMKVDLDNEILSNDFFISQ